MRRSTWTIWQCGHAIDVPVHPGEIHGQDSHLHKQAQEEFSLSDALLIAPATVTVNGDAGTVWRDKANSINTFSGQFLHVKPGKNLFYYTGDAGTIEISFTNRWFV